VNVSIQKQDRKLESTIAAVIVCLMRSLYYWIAAAVSLGSIQAAEPIAARDAKIGDVRLHYLTAGKGSAVLLLHGYAETSRMWRPLIPKLAEKFTVIAPDLPGIGDSSIPSDKLDMISAAQRIHTLVRSLGVEKARVVGHDIGLMVAYAYATKFPNETEKLVLMDAFLPGVAGWEPVYNDPHVWHFRFNGEYPEKLVQGRERTYFEYFWNVFAADKNHSIPEVIWLWFNTQMREKRTRR
jgi:pimeloyl-ACP methyl ester carboxylesterase